MPLFLRHKIALLVCLWCICTDVTRILYFPEVGCDHLSLLKWVMSDYGLFSIFMGGVKYILESVAINLCL
jgi:hypothetical protein